MTAPWKKGVHREYTAFSMEVCVRRDRDGTVKSHREVPEEDQEIAMSMEGSHGMVEGSWALLTESARAETMLLLLVKLSNDSEFKRKLISGDEISEDLIGSLSKDTLEQMTRGLKELLPQLTREAAQTVRDGLRHENE